MDDLTYAETVFYRAGPYVTGRVVRLLPGYTREIKIAQPAVMTVLVTAGLGRLLLSAMRAGGGPKRKWKDVRKAPEFLVTPLHLRDEEGRLCEVEIHGHVPQSALQPRDHIQVTVRRQADNDLAPRVERIVNITTRQVLRPRVPTLWSHIGPLLIVQAVTGLTIVTTLAAAWLLLRG